MDQLADRVEQLLVYGVITPGREEQTLRVYGHGVYLEDVFVQGNTISLLFALHKGQPNKGLTENGTQVPDLGSCPKLVLPLEAFPAAQ